MEATSILMILLVLLTLLGAAAATAGADTRDGLDREGFAHDMGPRFR